MRFSHYHSQILVFGILLFPCDNQVVGQLGMYGVLINGIQAAALEHKDMTTASWNGATSKEILHHKILKTCIDRFHLIVGLLVAFTAG
jgi:hypothetical protein